jgi:hypothetical protein
MRRQNLATASLAVWVQTNSFKPTERQYGLSALSGHRYPAWQQISRNPFAYIALDDVCHLNEALRDSVKDGLAGLAFGHTNGHLIYGLQTSMSVRDDVRVSSKMSDICVPIMHRGLKAKVAAAEPNGTSA